jgi:hypothetical protein
MDHDLDRVVQRMEVQREKRDRLADRARGKQEARRKPRAKRMRTVDDFDAIPPESGPISDSSADEKEEDEAEPIMQKKKTRFDFVRKPILQQQQQRRPSSMNDEEEEEVISDNGATRDCIVQPMVH